MSDPLDFLDDSLEARRKQHRLRSLSPLQPTGDGITVQKEGQSCINFSSNDYLGLAAHPKVIQKSQEYVKQYGSSATASRLICGTFDIHQKLEESLSSVFDKEAALIFNSGFQANSSILGAVTDRHSLILADKRSHNSLLQGSLASRAAFQRFNHNDADHLERLLQKAKGRYNRIWIVTESVFSMGGDRSPLDAIADLSNQYNALLFVDEAHAVGVWGEGGRGFAKNISEVDLLLGTCGKAFGSFGAYVVCSQKMRDYLINFCPGFIYTTALPPAVIGATQAALELIPTLDQQRTEYHRKITFFRESLQQNGFDTGPSSTQIIPLIIGDDEATLRLSKHLEEQGFLATAIRPPTVPEQSARIRLTLSARHTKAHLEKLLKALKSWKNE